MLWHMPCSPFAYLKKMQKSMQLSLDGMLSQHLQNKAGWIAFLDHVTLELQVFLWKL